MRESLLASNQHRESFFCPILVHILPRRFVCIMKGKVGFRGRWISLTLLIAQCSFCLPQSQSDSTALGTGLRCAERRNVPIEGDCEELFQKLYNLALEPGENIEKTYSQKVVKTDTTVPLPAVYYIGIRERTFEPWRPTTCQVLLNHVDIPGVRDYDKIKLKSIAESVESIVKICLEPQHRKGLDHPGRFGTVYAYVIRSPGPFHTNGTSPISSSVSSGDGATNMSSALFRSSISSAAALQLLGIGITS